MIAWAVAAALGAGWAVSARAWRRRARWLREQADRERALRAEAEAAAFQAGMQMGTRDARAVQLAVRSMARRRPAQ